MSSDRTAYLIFDIETVADGRLIQRIRYADQPHMSPSQAITTYKQQLLETSNGKSDFIPHTYHLPISVAVVKVDAGYALQDVRTLDRPRFRPQVIVRSFWKGWHGYGHPTLVTFNGRGFDLPVMELAAFRYGISVPAWFQATGPSYAQPRNRYNAQAHTDLQDVISNHGAVMIAGGLNLCAQLLGKPGKMETKGSQVQELWDAGEHLRIDNYCMCDALDTYFVFLRTRVLSGHITLAEERALVEGARRWVEAAAVDNPALADYLANFRLWRESGDEDDPFLAVAGAAG